MSKCPSAARVVTFAVAGVTFTLAESPSRLRELLVSGSQARKSQQIESLYRSLAGIAD